MVGLLAVVVAVMCMALSIVRSEELQAQRLRADTALKTLHDESQRAKETLGELGKLTKELQAIKQDEDINAINLRDHLKRKEEIKKSERASDKRFAERTQLIVDLIKHQEEQREARMRGDTIDYQKEFVRRAYEGIHVLNDKLKQTQDELDADPMFDWDNVHGYKYERVPDHPVTDEEDILIEQMQEDLLIVERELELNNARFEALRRAAREMSMASLCDEGYHPVFERFKYECVPDHPVTDEEEIIVTVNHLDEHENENSGEAATEASEKNPSTMIHDQGDCSIDDSDSMRACLENSQDDPDHQCVWVMFERRCVKLKNAACELGLLSHREVLEARGAAGIGPDAVFMTADQYKRVTKTPIKLTGTYSQLMAAGLDPATFEISDEKYNEMAAMQQKLMQAINTGLEETDARLKHVVDTIQTQLDEIPSSLEEDVAHFIRGVKMHYDFWKGFRDMQARKLEREGPHGDSWSQEQIDKLDEWLGDLEARFRFGKETVGVF